MLTPLRELVNRVGVVFDEDDLARIYAEDWAQLITAINNLERGVRGGTQYLPGYSETGSTDIVAGLLLPKDDVSPTTISNLKPLVDGQIVRVYNPGENDLTIEDNASSGSGTDIIICPSGDITVPQFGYVDLVYLSASEEWFAMLPVALPV